MTSPVSAGLKGKCPRCGRGSLFSGLLSVRSSCSVCELDLSKEDAGDGPAVFIIFILGAIMVPLVLAVEFKLTPPLWVHIVVWPPVVLGGALAMLRSLKGLMIALQYRFKASEGGHIDYD